MNHPPTPSVGQLESIPVDLYRDIHKAIRVELFDATTAAGRVDPADHGARHSHAAKLRDISRMLAMHAEHEDEVMDQAIRSVLPEQADSIVAEHASLDSEITMLVETAELALTRPAEDRACAQRLYLDLAAFTSRYLAHQDREERVVMPELYRRFGIEPLLEMNERIVSSIAPDDMAWSLSMMLPAMNVEDRVELLSGMREGAPAEVFEGVCGLASQVLGGDDSTALRQRLGLGTPVGVGAGASS